MAKRTVNTGTWAARPGATAAGSDFNPDYSYVRADLRRIAILAGSFLALLLALAFLLD